MTSPFMLTGLNQVRDKWGWFVVLGILMVLTGAIAMGCNVTTTLITMIVIGWMLLFTGVLELISAFSARNWGGLFLHLLGGALDVVLGYLFLAHPLQGAGVLTLFLAAAFFVGGIVRIGAAVSAQYPGWVWGLLSGVINVVLGVLLIRQWPYTGLWFIGFCVALEFIFRGWFWMMLGFSLRSMPKGAAPAVA